MMPQYRMAAQALGGDISKGNDQIGFPAVYESVYAAAKLPVRMAPREYVPNTVPFVGKDFQSQYHQQKKRDADRMANAKVQSTIRANVRAFSSPHGYFQMPAPVLGQRKFANPSLGAFTATSARRDIDGAPFSTVESYMSGGVLRSAEGQAYGKARLLSRIGQLNAIESSKVNFQLQNSGQLPVTQMAAPSMPGAPMAAPTPFGATTTGEVGESTKIELNLLLQGIIDALMSGMPSGNQSEGDRSADTLSRFTFADSTRALTIIFRLAPTANAEELEDVLEKVVTIQRLLNALLDPDRIEQSPEAVQSALTMKILFDKVADYIREMSSPKNINLSLVNRRLLSQALVRTLRFAEFLRRPDLQRLAQTAPAEGERAEAMDANDGDDFDDGATPREDDEEDNDTNRRNADFDSDDRQAFGYASGSYFGEPLGRDDAYSYNPFSREARQPRNVAFPGGEAVAATPSQPAEEAVAVTAREPSLRAFLDEETGAYNVSAREPSVKSSKAPSKKSVEDAMAAATQQLPGYARVPSGKAVAFSPEERSKASSAAAAAAPAARPAANPVVKPSIEQFFAQPERVVMKMKKTPVAAAAAPVAAAAAFPKTTAELPSSRDPQAYEKYVELANRINTLPPADRPTKDKLPISVYKGSKITNIRANFVKRLGLFSS